MNLDDLRKHIRDVPNFPKPGILFRDFTPLLENAQAFRFAIDLLTERYQKKGIEKIAVVESRGFIVGAPLALALGAGCVVVRKPGKLPYKTDRVTYQLEYGTDTLEMHQGAIKPQEKVLIVDDLLATGGTVGAVRKLVEKQGGLIHECAFVMELLALQGRKALHGLNIFSLLQY